MKCNKKGCLATKMKCWGWKGKLKKPSLIVVMMGLHSNMAYVMCSVGLQMTALIGDPSGEQNVWFKQISKTIWREQVMKKTFINPIYVHILYNFILIKQKIEW